MLDELITRVNYVNYKIRSLCMKIISINIHKRCKTLWAIRSCSVGQRTAGQPVPSVWTTGGVRQLTNPAVSTSPAEKSVGCKTCSGLPCVVCPSFLFVFSVFLNEYIPPLWLEKQETIGSVGSRDCILPNQRSVTWSSATWGKLLNLSEPQLVHLPNGANISNYVVGMLWWLNLAKEVKHSV